MKPERQNTGRIWGPRFLDLQAELSHGEKRREGEADGSQHPRRHDLVSLDKADGEDDREQR